MAIGFVGQTQIGSGGTTDPTSAPSLPPSTANGNLVLLFVIVKYASTTINTPSGWTLLNNGAAANSGLTDSGNDAGNIRAAIFWREKDAGWSAMPAVDLSGVPNISMVGAISYSKAAGETWVAPEGANAVDNTGSTTGVDPPAAATTISFAAGDWFGSFAALNGDAGTLGTHTATVAGVTFGTQNQRLAGTTSGGTDLLGNSIDKTYTSGTASAGPDGSLPITALGGTAGAGVMIFYRLRVSGGAPTVTGTGAGAATASGTATGTPTTKGTAVGAATASGAVSGFVIRKGVLAGSATASGVVAGTVIFAVHGVAVGGATASGSVSAYRHPPGAFTVDFSLYPDGPVPIADTGLRDSFLDIPRSQDEMGVRGGKLAVVNFRGPDQAFYPADAGGGRRGLLWRNTVTLTDNVSGLYDGSMFTGAPPAVPAMQPALHISTDPADTWLGIAVWFVPAPYSWAELGVIGWKQEDFSYLDMAPGLAPSLSQTDDIRLRSVGGQVAVEVNGVTVLGPCVIPAEILGSPLHGVQMDVAADTDEELGVMESVIIEADSTPLATRSAPLTPGVGTQVEQASSTTINVPYPTTVVAGETLFCILCSRNGGTFSAAGWTLIPSGFGAALNTQINVLRKTATGSESGNLTVTKSTAGVMAGVMVRASGEQKTATSLTGQANTTASLNIPTPASKILGPRRTMIWIGATSIDTGITMPTGFTPLHVGVAGGQAIRMAVGVALVDSLADTPVYPYNSYLASNLSSRTGTAAASAASAAGFLLMFPAYAGTPTRYGTGSGAAAATGTATGTVTAGGVTVTGVGAGAATGSGVSTGKVTRKGVLVGAATASGIATGKPVHKGTLVGAATASGVVVGKVTRKGVLQGTGVGSGVILGRVVHTGIAIGAGVGSGVVVGKVTRKGVLAGAAVATGTAVGSTAGAPVVTGTAVGAATASGVALGKPIHKGILVGAATATGVVVGKVTRKGVLVGAATASGVVVGKVTHKGVLVGSATAAGTAVGSVVAEVVTGTAVGTSVASGVATGKVTRRGTLVGGATATGIAVGKPVHKGVLVGTATATGVAVGKPIHKGVLAGGASSSGTVTGKVRRFGVLAGTAVAAGVATGGAFVPGTGVCAGTATATGTATGKRTTKGVLVGAAVATGTVVGAPVKKGTLVGAATSTGTVTGRVTRKGVLVGAATATGTAAGTITAEQGFGLATGTATSTGTVTGKVTRRGTLVGTAVATGVLSGTVRRRGTLIGAAQGAGVAQGTRVVKATGAGAALSTALVLGRHVVVGAASATGVTSGTAIGRRVVWGIAYGPASATGVAAVSSVTTSMIGGFIG